MKVNQFMSRILTTAEPTDTLGVVFQRMQEGQLHSVPVVDHGELSGIITDRDVRKSWSQLDTMTVSQAMTANVITANAEDDLCKAAELMVDHRIGGLPVLTEGRLVGMVTMRDVLRAFCMMHAS